MTPPRVTILTKTNGWGGTEEVTLGLVETLEARGHPAAVVDLQDNVYEAPLRQNGLRARYRHLPAGAKLRRLPFERYEAALRDLGSDVCVLSKGAFNVRAPQLDRAARATSRRYVVIEHLAMTATPVHVVRVGNTVMSWNPLWYHRRRGIRAHLAAPDLVVCVSRAVRERLVAEFGDDWRSEVIHNGIDTEAFRFDAAGRRRMRAEWGIPHDAFVFGFLARLSEVKAPDVALRQFARAGGSASGWLIFGGDGPDRAQLEREAAALGVADRVRFTGWIGRETRTAVLSAFDAFVMPSRTEGLPLALLEAMAMERLCIASGVGGVGEVLTDATVGWQVEPGNDAAFGIAMQRASAATAAEREALGRQARLHVERHFQRRRQLDRLAAAVLGEPTREATA